MTRVLSVELVNRSGIALDEEAVAALAREVLASEGITAGELGIQLVPPDEMRSLKRDHLGVDETTDVLSFPIDGRADVAPELPRQLGDVVLCPQVAGDSWRAPLVHGLLHLLGYDHGARMRTRESAFSGSSG